jgi:hypothetical protein
MNSMQSKKECILENETAFAYELSAVVFEKPKMNVWMILIPIIIVFHMYRHQRYVDGRRAFIDNYLITRKRALEAAHGYCEHGNNVDLDRFESAADLPPETRPVYRQWIELLSEHYQTLISSQGRDYKDLVRDGYKTKTNYLLFLNRLNQAEKQFNRALKPHIQAKEDPHVIEQTIAKIEHHTEILRRQGSENIFA